jgi:hypothetical protein
MLRPITIKFWGIKVTIGWDQVCREMEKAAQTMGTTEANAVRLAAGILRTAAGK